ncbi:hypothetical protein GGX14DRAFT_544818 [Mycena pura]|uniref:Uncharacterized protein n=1 Tax=Mycena pura TaxID=153505 RepID=A0AAD6V569_9AGAR|nr:hypothetical protein GGX14DRAFT_544818 [Mycena pura]
MSGSPPSNYPVSNAPRLESDILFPSFVALIVQATLFGMILPCTWNYYHWFGREDWKIYQLLVGVLFSLNVVIGAIDLNIVQHTFGSEWVTHTTDVPVSFLQTQSWTICAEPVVTTVVVLLAQMYSLELCWRATRVSRIALASVALLFPLCLGSGLAYDLFVSFDCLLTLFRRYSMVLVKAEHLDNIDTAGVIWLASMMLWDLALGFMFTVDPSEITAPFQIFSCAFGMLKFSIKALTLFSLVRLPGTAWYLVSGFCLPRVVTLEVLFSLLARNSEDQILIVAGTISEEVTVFSEKTVVAVMDPHIHMTVAH